MGAHYVVNPSNETDLLRFMKRPDLYQFADLHQVDYPKDAPAEIMKQLIRASGKFPMETDFNVKTDSRTGQVLSVSYKRLAAPSAPPSKHAEADAAATAKQLAKKREELENLTDRKLRTLVRDQFGEKMLDRELDREGMIELFVGQKSEDAELRGVITQDENAETKTIPDWLLDSQTPMQLVKICKQLGIAANIKDGKKVLLEKVRGHAA